VICLVLVGWWLHQTRRSHTGRDVRAFFRWIDMHVDPDLELHVILDGLSAHKSRPVRDRLAHKKRRRWHLHFTPTTRSSTKSPAGK
jgi:transposase